jgi:hypothetical protein
MTWPLWSDPITFPMSLNMMTEGSTSLLEAERLESFEDGK